MKTFSLSIFFLIATAPHLAFAAAQNLTNSASVVSACTISTVDNINLGSIDTLNFTTAEDTGAVQIVCSQGTFTVTIDNGRNARQSNVSNVANGAQYTKTYTCQRRMMSSTGQTVAYNVYHTNNVGVNNNKSVTSSTNGFDSSYCANSSAGFTSLTFSPVTGSTQNVVMIGRAFPTTSTGATPGVYTDTLMYTVNF